MLNIEILCVGRMSQKWFSDGFEEYRKRLSAFDKVTVTEISEYRITDDTDSARAEAVKREGEVLLRHLREDGRSVRVAMCVEGKQYSSEELAQLRKQADEAYLKWVELELEISKNNLQQTAQQE